MPAADSDAPIVSPSSASIVCPSKSKLMGLPMDVVAAQSHADRVPNPDHA
jgi:hypothetical protein